MIDSRLLRKDTLSSVIIGVVPRRSDKEVCCVFLDLLFRSDQVGLVFICVRVAVMLREVCKRFSGSTLTSLTE